MGILKIMGRKSCNSKYHLNFTTCYVNLIKEKLALNKAKEILGDSFNIKKSLGFIF